MVELIYAVYHTKSALALFQKTHFITELALCLALAIFPNLIQ